MSRKPFKKGSSAPFIQIEHWVYDCEAWQSLKPGPKALYLALKRRFNGHNNGELFLSQRDAAKELSVGRDTVGKYYADLQDAGFIVQTVGHCLGPSGLGQSAKWALTEYPLNRASATKEFMSWKKQNPRRKIQHSLAGKSNTPCRKIQLTGFKMSENPATLGQNAPETVSDNPAIYTSNHMPIVPDLSLRAGLDLCPLRQQSLSTPENTERITQ
jgi:hypothetical protein